MRIVIAAVISLRNVRVTIFRATTAPTGRRITRASVALLASVTLLGGSVLAAQTPEPRARLPFFPGESLTYRVRVTGLGDVGGGAMWVEGPVAIRRDSAYLLHSDFRSRLGSLKATNHSASWLDSRRMASLRFQKRERQPFSSVDEAVELFPGERRWEAASGAAGASPSDEPLDELSFIYFVRTLGLAADTVYRFDRHFDSARNPTTVRVVGRGTVRTGTGESRAIIVEMRVRDQRRYLGEGLIRLHLTDDHCRIPVRIESRTPGVGTVVLTLESHNHPPTHFVPPAR